MHPSSLISVNLYQLFSSSLLANLCASLVHDCVVAKLCVRIKLQMISLSIHCIEGSYFGSLVNIMHIKCCYTSMKSAMEVKICELIVY